MKAHEVITRLANESSKLAKEQIIREAWDAGCIDFFNGALLAYDRLTTFGVKKVPKLVENDGKAGETTFIDFKVLAKKLADRELTGHAALAAIDDFLQKTSFDEWNGFYRLILLKDYKCGMTESTVNKVLKNIAKTDKSANAYIVPVFSCQLAPSESYNANTLHEIKGDVFVDIKYDGMRIVTVMDKTTGEVTQYTRSGIQNDNFPHVREALKKVMDELPASLVIDGEIVSSSFKALMRQATRDDADTTGTTLMIFDAVPLTHFHAGESPLSQELRHAALVDMAGLLQKHGKDILYVLPKSRFNLNDPVDKEKFLAMFKQVMIDRESDPKLEGLMVKKVDAGYRCKRWAGWEKVKPYVDASLAVVGLEEGSADSKYVGMLGALVCKGVEGDRNITVKVGGGISDAERKAWWNNPELVMGMIAEIEGHEFSQDEKSEGTNNWSIRHPRLKGWRGGKPGEKM